MREAAADLQGGGQDHWGGGMRPEQGKGRGERMAMTADGRLLIYVRASRNEETTDDDR